MRERDNETTVQPDGLIDVDLEMGAEELRENLSEVLSRVAFADRRVLVTRRGRPVAVILPIADAAHYAVLLDKDDREALAQQREPIIQVEGVLDEPGAALPHQVLPPSPPGAGEA